MPKFTKQELYTELSIQIAQLTAKVDKLLDLAMKPTYEITLNELVSNFNNNLTQWPNESHNEYLRRIGQYNEAQSDNETFEDSYK